MVHIYHVSNKNVSILHTYKNNKKPTTPIQITILQNLSFFKVLQNNLNNFKDVYRLHTNL